MLAALRAGFLDPGVDSRPRPANHHRIRKAALALAVAFVLTSGLAFAGHLPDAAQEAVADAFDLAGLEGLIPHPETDPDFGVGPAGGGATDAPQVTDSATDPETTGVGKARAVTEAATDDDQIPEFVPGTPSEPGPETGDEASGGAATAGQQTGEEAAEQGAENADRRGP